MKLTKVSFLSDIQTQPHWNHLAWLCRAPQSSDRLYPGVNQVQGHDAGSSPAAPHS